MNYWVLVGIVIAVVSIAVYIGINRDAFSLGDHKGSEQIEFESPNEPNAPTNQLDSEFKEREALEPSNVVPIGSKPKRKKAAKKKSPLRKTSRAKLR